MSRKPDKFAVEDAVWLKAVAREAVILPLASKARLSPADVGLACRQLEVGRARLYELLGRYRTTPATSSLLDLTSGPNGEDGAWRRRWRRSLKPLCGTPTGGERNRRLPRSTIAFGNCVVPVVYIRLPGRP